MAHPLQPRKSRTDSVRADYFDTEGCAALTRTLSRMSQQSDEPAPGSPIRHRRRGSSFRQIEEAIPPSPQPANTPGEAAQSGSSGQGTVVGPSDEKFDFGDRLKAALNRMDDEDIKKRELGVGFVALTVRGLGAAAKYQPTIFSAFSLKAIRQSIHEARHPPVKDILSNFAGVVRSGEMLLVLGSPGSGCTTLLKVLANQRQGYHEITGDVSYDGIDPQYLAAHYRGDVSYAPEDDTHFPSLSVKNTLSVAAKMRTPQNRLENLSRPEFVQNIVETLATVFGLRHTFETPVGDESIRGVSGGEKKRVSIAEMMATRVRIGCWDNSTRGLDSSTALEFVRALRIATDVGRATTIVTIYQAAESLYHLFDKVCVLYSGKQIYFGPADSARQYFIDMGWEPANRQTTADFLVSVTDPLARTPRSGWESRVPRTAEEFAARWAESSEGKANRADAESYVHAPEDHTTEKGQLYKESARAERATTMSSKSPYTVSLMMQVRGVMLRRVQIMRGDLAAPAITAMSFVVQALIMGSVFLKMPVATSAYFSRGGVLFFSVLFGALSAMAEIPALYAQRPIVARHQKAAMYHPFIEALALTVVDIPITFVTQALFDVVIYWMTGLQRAASNFFIFLLVTVFITLTMKAFFRALAASFPQESAAQAVGGIGILALVLYTGYTIPRPSMIGALKWITWINPMRYGFEALVVNEFHGLKGECSMFAPSGPGYQGVSIANQVCTTVGATAGQSIVDGDTFVELSFGYSYDNLWRNFGIVVVFWIGFVAWFLFATERAGNIAGGATQLVFKQGARIDVLDDHKGAGDAESGSAPPDEIAGKKQHEAEVAQEALPESRTVFSWHHLSYDITVSGGKKRRLLDDVSGFVAPGKMTALMGESGAGKTTLLNALAERVSTGVISGDRFVNGHPLPRDFAAQTGYCQQMDIHMGSTTVREALLFSAELRQPKSVPMAEKRAFVEEVIKMCAMESYADAVVGTVGEGLNVEQRKRLTIGVELAAKPQLLLFLDEPTSGLDSQSAWAIIEFLRSLANRGQAILCTIHQPSSELFQSFDRLLLLRKGGQTCYFGDLGDNASTLIAYFERNGGRKCQADENPAEYMLDVIGAGATASSDVDWHGAWNNAPESAALEDELNVIHSKGREEPVNPDEHHPEFATGHLNQLSALLKRAFRHYVRNPTYIMSKMSLNILSGLFIGFTFFQADNSIQGSQNKLFAIFMATILCTSLSNQMQVEFINLRNIYEYRERQSKMYSWVPLVTSCILVELPFNIFGSAMFYFCWYWTVGFSSEASRAGYMWLIVCILFPLYYTTFSQFVAAMAPDATIAGILFSLFFSFVITFNGVLQPYSQLIPFWRWMYRLSPFTYLIEGMFVDAVGQTAIQCASKEIQTLSPPSGQSCQAYMSQYISQAGGYLLNPDESTGCQFCPRSSADTYLSTLNMSFSHRWRNIGLLFAYIIFNTFLVYVCTYVFRIRRSNPLSAVRRLLFK
ncbi:pleiotropic drug resistance ABC transporter [Ceratobasidium sp. AG-I]|nr:pleiotropic drug resistance ABC transporter [Ceratobasidium sp. AG-I]